MLVKCAIQLPKKHLLEDSKEFKRLISILKNMKSEDAQVLRHNSHK
jgi:hypothetical protein